MTQVIRNNKTIFELQEDPGYEWEDGDDTALYDEGYEAGKNAAINVIDKAIKQLDKGTFGVYILDSVKKTIERV